jgi:hypothetical protein
MWPTRSLVRAALSASLFSTMTPMLATVGMLGECSVAIAGSNVVHELKPVTDELFSSRDIVRSAATLAFFGIGAREPLSANSRARSSRSTDRVELTISP